MHAPLRQSSCPGAPAGTARAPRAGPGAGCHPPGSQTRRRERLAPRAPPGASPRPAAPPCPRTRASPSDAAGRPPLAHRRAGRAAPRTAHGVAVRARRSGSPQGPQPTPPPGPRPRPARPRGASGARLPAAAPRRAGVPVSSTAWLGADVPALHASAVGFRPGGRSRSLLAFPPTDVLPGVACPAVGPVGLGSPPARSALGLQTRGPRLHDPWRSHVPEGPPAGQAPRRHGWLSPEGSLLPGWRSGRQVGRAPAVLTPWVTVTRCLQVPPLQGFGLPLARTVPGAASISLETLTYVGEHLYEM
jgi:hypothetical protein